MNKTESPSAIKVLLTAIAVVMFIVTALILLSFILNKGQHEKNMENIRTCKKYHGKSIYVGYSNSWNCELP